MCIHLNLPLPPPLPPLKICYYTDKETMDNTKIKVLFIGGKNIPIDVHTHIKVSLEILLKIVKYLDYTSTLSGGGAF